MTVSGLIKLLEKLPQDALVIQSRDSEGNGYSPTASLCKARYQAGGTYSDDLLDDEEEPEGGVQAVVLWPTN